MADERPRQWITPDWMQLGVDAMRETLDGDPRLKRQMVQFLLDESFWDTDKLGWDGALARFNACLNPARSEFFKLSEVWALMKRFDRHHTFLAMAHDLGYEVRRRSTEERKQELLERLVLAMERLGHEREFALAEAERLASVPPDRGMDPVVRAGSGRFSMPGGF